MNLESFADLLSTPITMKLALINEIDTLLTLLRILEKEGGIEALIAAFPHDNPQAQLDKLVAARTALEATHHEIENQVLAMDKVMNEELGKPYTALVQMLGKLQPPINANASLPNFRYSFASIPPVSWKQGADSKMYITDGPPSYSRA